MQPTTVRTAAALLALALLAAAGMPAIAGEEAARPLQISFKPQTGKHFTLRFASEDRRNCYELVYTPENTLELRKIAKGRETSLARVEWPAPANIAVWQRPREIRVDADGRTILLSSDTSFRGSQWALEPPDAAAAPVQTARPDDAVLDDDFEDADATAESWTAELGAWRVRARYDELAERNGGPPMFSTYQPTGDGLALAAAGKPHWADLALTALVRIGGRQRAGLAFNIHDRGNFAAFVIEPGDGGAGRAQLLDFRNGTPDELAAFEPLPIEPNQWYGLRVEIYADQAWCSILGLETHGWRPVAGSVPGCRGTTSGRIGLVSFGAGVEFDNAAARPLVSFADTLESPQPSRWKLDGHWRYRGDELHGSGTARLLNWPRDVSRIDIELTPREGGGAIFSNAPTGRTYSAFGMFGGEWQFRRVTEGKPAVLARAPVLADGSRRLTMLRSPGAFECFVDGRRVLDVCDIGMPDYGGGLLAEDAAFTCFRVVESAEESGAEIFAGFSRIRAADAISEQERLVLPEMLQPSTPAWHVAPEAGRTTLACSEPGRALFCEALPGAVSVTARLRSDSRGGVVLAADGEGGYRLCISDAGRSVSLYRNDLEIIRRPVRDPAGTVDLFLARRGGRIAAYVNDHPLLAYPDPVPLAGNRVGLVADGPAVFERMTVRAPLATQYTFESFNPAWLERGGDWVLHGGRMADAPADWLRGGSRDGEAWLVERAVRTGAFTWYLTVSPATEGYADGGSKTFPIENVRLILTARPDDPAGGYGVVLRPDGRNEIALMSGNRCILKVDLDAPDNEPMRVGFERGEQALNVSVNGRSVLRFEETAAERPVHLAIGLSRSYANFSRLLILPHNAAP